MSEQVLDVKESFRLIRRFWRTVAVFVVAGVAAAAAYEVRTLPHYQATSLVLLPSAGTSATGPPTHSVTTEGRIATSAAVLVPAGRSVDRSLSLQDLEARVSTTDAAASVLRITTSGPTPGQAQALANAVATQLVRFLATSGSASNANVLSALRSEFKQLNVQIGDVQKELGVANTQLAADRGTAAAASAESDLVAKLTSQESSLQLQLNSVKSQITQAGEAQIAANDGTEVIQRATTATPPSVSALVLPAVLGALGGLLVGSVAVLAWRRRDPRLRTRDSMAATLGAPVLASLRIPTRRSPADWASLFEDYHATPLEQWSIRRALRELGAGEGGIPALTVVSLAGDTAGIAQAAHVALASATSGAPTSFSVTGTDDGVAALRAACARYEEEGRVPRANLVVGGTSNARANSAALSVTALVVGDGGPVVAPSLPPAPALLSVSAGFASAQQLATAAVAAADAGRAISGILVANPTSSDNTVGRFAEAGPRTFSIRQRRPDGARTESTLGRAR